MAIDTAEKRKSVAGYQPVHVSVTPNASPDVEWRQEVAWGYPGIALSAPAAGTYPLHALATDTILHAEKSMRGAENIIAEIFLVDEAGNFLVDEAGNFLVALEETVAILFHALSTDTILHAEDLEEALLIHALMTDTLLHAEAL